MKNKDKSRLLGIALLVGGSFIATKALSEMGAMDTLVEVADKLDLATTVLGLIAAVGASWFAQSYQKNVADDVRDQDKVKDNDKYMQAQFAAQASNLKLKEAELQAHKALADKLHKLLTELSNDDLGEMSVSIREAVLSNASEEVLQELQKRYSIESRVGHLSSQIYDVFESSEKRLTQEVALLRGRANLNMIIGVFIATLGAGVLASSLLPSGQPVKTYTDVFINMLPRASVVLLIELLAYFFLRMYRSVLSDIRYYQNEITNLEMKKASALLALDSESVDSVLLNFCGTDRNTLMKSDQTTLELERLKVESQTFKNTLNTLSVFFAKANK